MQRATGATKTVLHWEMFPNVSITDWEAVDMRWETSQECTSKVQWRGHEILKQSEGIRNNTFLKETQTCDSASDGYGTTVFIIKSQPHDG